MESVTRGGKSCVLVTIILSAACLVFLALFASFYIKYEKNKDTTDGVCYSLDCLRSASFIAGSMNMSVDPCQDFYQFACGRWMEQNPLSGNTGKISIYSKANWDSLQMLKGLLTANDPTSSHEIQKARAYYRSCMDVDTINRLGTKPVLDLFNLTGGGVYPTLQPSWRDTGMTFSDIVQYLLTVGGIGAFAYINMEPQMDMKDSDELIIQFSQGHLVLENREVYLGDRNSRELILLQDMYRKVVVALGANETIAAADAKDVVDFERKLANVMEPADVEKNKIAQYKKMTLAALTERLPQFNWTHYLRSQFAMINRTDKITEDMLVAITAVHFYAALFDLTQNGIKNLPERWVECVDLTKRFFSSALQRLYVKKVRREQEKKGMEYLVDHLLQGFKELLQEINWMSQPTKDAALKKLSFMGKRIGYSSELLEDKAPRGGNNTYLIDERPFFENSIKNLKTRPVVLLKLTGRRISRKGWTLAAYDVDAGSNFKFNTIEFPAAFLSPPILIPEFSDALFYGRMGTIAGHEITHVFDSKGAAHDEKGKLRQWWEKEDLKKFKNRVQCLVDQYSQFVDKELNMSVNGQLTLNENIADCGGIRQAFRGAYTAVHNTNLFAQAYRDHVKKRGQEENKYPMLPYTQNQLFFVGFGQLWCSNVAPKTRAQDLQIDVHSPDYFRVIGPLQNSEDFARVFKCPVGSPMNPQRKCQVW